MSNAMATPFMNWLRVNSVVSMVPAKMLKPVLARAATIPNPTLSQYICVRGFMVFQSSQLIFHIQI